MLPNLQHSILQKVMKMAESKPVVSHFQSLAHGLRHAEEHFDIYRAQIGVQALVALEGEDPALFREISQKFQSMAKAADWLTAPNAHIGERPLLSLQQPDGRAKVCRALDMCK